MALLQRLLLLSGLACYAGTSAGLPLFLHHSLDHEHICHAHSDAADEPVHGFQDGHASDPSDHPAACPVCDQLARASGHPALAAEPLGWTGDAPVQRPKAAPEMLAASQASLVFHSPRAPPTA